MSMEEVAVPPAKMTLVNLITGEPLEVQFNPEELGEEVSANWTKVSIPGLGHQLLQFVNTNNHTFSLDLFFDGEGAEQLARLDDARRYLLSLTYPVGSAGDVATGGPPRVLFVWPNLVSFSAQVTKVSMKHQRFTKNLASSRFLAAIEVEEVRDGRLTSEEVRAYGTQRGSGG
jgi:hypothetical protein